MRPEMPVDPSDILRGLDSIRSALGAPGNVGDALPRVVERAEEVTAAINRLSDEVALLNANAARAIPVLESIERHVQRSLPVLDSIQLAEKGIQSAIRMTMGRAAPERPARGRRAAPPAAQDAERSEPDGVESRPMADPRSGQVGPDDADEG